MHLFTKTNKLVVYFKDDRYTVIVVKPEWYNEFVKDICKRKPRTSVTTIPRQIRTIPMISAHKMTEPLLRLRFQYLRTAAFPYADCIFHKTSGSAMPARLSLFL